MRVNSNERGVVLVLVALMATALVLLVALAIDTTIASSSKAQRHHSSEFAALGALEAFSATTGTFDTRLLAAQGRARTIIGDNAPLMVGTPFLQQTLVARSQDQVLRASSTSPGGMNGKIMPGIWHFAEPAAPNNCAGGYTSSVLSPNCPCNTDSAMGVLGWNRRCFEELPFGVGVVADALNSNRANAIRVELNLSSDSLLKNIFGGVMGQGPTSFSSVATASIVPRHAVFMIDLSPSVVQDTHLPVSFDLSTFLPLNDGIGSKYAYQTAAGTACPGTPLVANMEDEMEFQDYQIYQYLLPTRPAGPQVTTLHYKDEFLTCVDIKPGMSKIKDSPVPGESHFLDSIVAPEPLTSILDSIHATMKVFSNRVVTNDLVGIVGFDDDILDTRVLDMKPPPRPDIDMNPPASPGPYDEFMNFYNATDISVPNSNALQFLFPRTFGMGGRPNPALTDLPNALVEVYDMISTAPNSISVESYAVLFSDGLTNCVVPNDVFTRLNIAAPNAGTGAGCGFSKIDGSIIQSRAILDKFAEDKIAVHMFLVGESTRPHTLLRKGGNGHGGGCMTDIEARSEDPKLPYVNFDSNDTNFLPGSVPDYRPNELYSNAVDSNGLWIPLRPCCNSACNDVTAGITAECNATGGNRGKLVSNISAIIGSGPAEVLPQYFDKGRLLCDPSGRTIFQQVQDAINLILSRNPIVLVE